MHEPHISLQELLFMTFWIGGSFCVCCYCCIACFNRHLEIVMPNPNRRDIDSDADFSENESSNDESSNDEYYTSEDEELSPRTIRVINKYGHFKPDYSSQSDSNSDNEYGINTIPLIAYG